MFPSRTLRETRDELLIADFIRHRVNPAHLDGITLTIEACDPVAAYKSERVNLLGNGAGGLPRDTNHSRASSSENSGNSRLVRQRPWRTMAGCRFRTSSFVVIRNNNFCPWPSSPSLRLRSLANACPY